MTSSAPSTRVWVRLSGLVPVAVPSTLPEASVSSSVAAAGCSLGSVVTRLKLGPADVG